MTTALSKADKKAAKGKLKKYRKEGTLGLWTGFGMLGAMIIAGAIIPRVSKFDPNEPSLIPMMAPSRTNFFGTDSLGRDIFVRVFDAVFVDLGTAIIGVSIPLVVGTIIGTLLGISRNKRVNSLVGSLKIGRAHV